MDECFGCRNYGDKVGVLVAQLGTPDEPTPRALKRYLKQFLSDRRVIEVPRLLWWFILNFIILQTRPKRSAANYARVWTSDGSPLLRITNSQAEHLQARLRLHDPSVEVVVGMRYGSPSIESAVEKLVSSGCTKIVLLPMYPQYAAPTTASVYDAFFPALLRRRWVPTVKVVEPFFRHPLYIEAVCEGIKESLRSLGSKPDKVILSYHGMPKEYVEKGDSYCCMCTATTSLIEQRLSLEKGILMHTFQSRFGKAPWLTPYTDETFESLAKAGAKSIVVACPGFVADCLETIDEIGNEGLHQFKSSGGESLTLVPCVNDSVKFISCLEAVIMETAGPWLVTKNCHGNCSSKICGQPCPSGLQPSP